MNKKEILEQLLLEHPIHKMVKFSDLNIQDKLKENVFMIVRYREFYYKELSIMDELQIKYDKLIGIQYKYYRFEDEKEWTKVEIEKYCLPADKKIIQMKNIIDRQNIKIRFFEMCFRGFEKMQWSMKSFIDVLKTGN